MVPDMKIGLVGVGPWGRELARAFQKEGCRVVGYARKTPEPRPNYDLQQALGERFDSVEKLVRSDKVELVLAMAGPRVSRHAARLAAEWGKPCVQTKPCEPEEAVDSSVIVDFWRLDSHPWVMMKAALRNASQARNSFDRITIDFYGDGPKRDFSGVWDYGPHALAFLADLTGLEFSELAVTCEGELFSARRTSENGLSVDVLAGLTDARARRVAVRLKDGATHVFSEEAGVLSYERPGAVPLRQAKADVLRWFARRSLTYAKARLQSPTAEYAFRMAPFLSGLTPAPWLAAPSPDAEDGEPRRDADDHPRDPLQGQE